MVTDDHFLRTDAFGLRSVFCGPLQDPAHHPETVRERMSHETMMSHRMSACWALATLLVSCADDQPGGSSMSTGDSMSMVPRSPLDASTGQDASQGRGPLVSDASSGSAESSELPALIVVEKAGIEPEGIEYDPEHHRFLLGSRTTGTVYAVADDGAITPFVEDPDLVSILGIEVDEMTDRLLVVNNGVLGGGDCLLGIYDLDSGERQALVDLGDPGTLVNDVTVDAEGTAYITNTFNGRIYAVSTDGAVSIFASPDELGTTLSLNGIVYHPDGYLLVAGFNRGVIYRVPIDDPSMASELALDIDIAGPDGLVLHPNGELVVSSFLSQQVRSIRSEDGFVTGNVTSSARLTEQITTVAIRGVAVYAIRPQLDKEREKPVIEQVDLRPVL